MPNTLRIKRRATGGGAGAPSGLANAELAYNEQTNILYYGWGTGGAGGTATQVIPIAGSGSYTFVDGSNANGTWPISINGNSATVTNGVYTSRSINTGDGLSGGGDLSANRTLSVDSSVVRTTGNQTINGAKTFGNLSTFNAGINMNDQTASTIAGFDSSKNLSSLNTATYPNLTELSYVKGVTSSIQTQLGNKVDNSRTLTPGSGLVGSAALDLSANRTFDIGQGDGISVSTDAIAVDNTVVRTTGIQTLAGVKTFSNTPIFSSGATVTGDLTVSGSGLVASNINNFDSQVRTSRLDQMAAPTADVSLNSRKITNLATPTADTDAATKAYVDAARAGLDVKQSVRVATTIALNTSISVSYGSNTISGNTNAGVLPNIDGVSLSVGDRILVKDETSTNIPFNGIYTVSSLGNLTGSSWVLTRATDADSSAEVSAGMFTFVTEGTANADSGWVLTTNDTITLNTTNLTFAQFSGAGQIIAVSGLAKNGNNLGLATAYGDTINPYGSKTANTVLAAPNGSAGVPSFRSLAAADIPSLGNITNSGAIGSTANLPIITTTNGVLSAGSFGSTANTFCQGNDSRLSDTRNTSNSLTVNNAGAGTASPFTFNGSAAQTLSYNSIGAPSISGANATGTWNISITGNAGTVTSGVYTNRSITINGTTNQITSSAAAQDLSADRTWTLSLPQNIHSTATPTFAGLTINGYISARTPASANAATQIVVFSADPSATTQAVVTRTPTQLLSDIGGYAASNPNGYTNNTGTVTSITAGSGMNFTNITTSGPVNMGVPSAITLSSTNSLTSNSHTHAFTPGGTTSQYIRGDGVATSGAALTKTDDTNVTLTIGGSPTNALLSATSLTLGWTGNLAVNRGGTGQTSYINGELLIGNTTGNTLTKATLTAGTGISITNGAGSITVAHSDTSPLSAGTVGASGISSITIDDFGHIQSVTSTTYLTQGTLCAAFDAAACVIDGGTF